MKKCNNRIVLLFSLFILGLYSIGICVPTSRVVRGIKERFDIIHDFHAKISQSNQDIFGNTIHYTGEIYFKKPQFIRLSYFEEKSINPSQIAITDGNYFWLYTAELKQITKQIFNPSSLPLPLMILGGATQIDEDFREKYYIRPIEREIINGIDTYRIIVRPKFDNPVFIEQRIWVNESNYLPVKAKVKDKLGNISTVIFSNIKLDQGIPNELFKMEIKEGISFIEYIDLN